MAKGAEDEKRARMQIEIVCISVKSVCISEIICTVIYILLYISWYDNADGNLRGA